MDFLGKKVLVVGLARSGMATIKLLSILGATIYLSESKSKTEIEELSTLESLGVTVLDQSLEVFEKDYDLVVKNPGVPYKTQQMQKLHDRKIPVITEIELAYRVAKPQTYIAITGTNGKTTTASLTYEIIKKAYGEKVHLCGNIGIPLCEIVVNENLLNEEGHIIVLEVSNFQLINIDEFRPTFATIINLSPDHVDFMGSIEEYYESKTRVYKNMKDDDIFLLNMDDVIVNEYVKKYPVSCKVQSFSLEKEADIYIKCDNIISGVDGKGNNTASEVIKNNVITAFGEEILPLDSIKAPGKHNLQNTIVAVFFAKALGINNEIIKDVVEKFNGVEHRMEFVREIDNVKYYNDSKATNTDATVTALKAFDKGVILLIGGFEKGLSMDNIKANLDSVKKIIGFGACGRRLVDETVGTDGIVVETLEEAVTTAKKIAESGDVILLSPTTSSFDQYSCFEERGEHFKKLVYEL
ncbi:MAG: UDP-N-acetylmuramoyl-L-alanine--D-glutamate ligase [Ruminococcaceae bacterium]|nr:UDP-N-acetylmuramoyl-L-alanine--D-glutamate ligase [Oscillospiraceae bacterium]